MMVVITIIVILITMAIPIYQKSIIRSREAVLIEQSLHAASVIDNYTYDKEKAPQSSERSGLRRISQESSARSHHEHRSVEAVMEDATQAVNQSEPGIFDIHSNSDKISLDGTPYSSW